MKARPTTSLALASKVLVYAITSVVLLLALKFLTLFTSVVKDSLQMLKSAEPSKQYIPAFI